jgi:hypothetical protein
MEAATQLPTSSFSPFRTTRTTPGSARHTSGAISLAHPVTMICRPGLSRAALRIAWRACASASAVTAQVFTTIESFGANRRIIADSCALSRQPKVMTSAVTDSAKDRVRR